MGSQVITRPPSDAPLDVELGALDELTPQSAFAHYDGSGAAGDFLPALTYYTQSGEVFARALGLTVTAGESADVSFFPGLSAPATSSASGGGITATTEQLNQSAVVTTIANSGTTVMLPTNHLAGPVLFSPSGGQMKAVAAGVYAVNVNVQLRSAAWTAGGGFQLVVAYSAYNQVSNPWVTFPTVTADTHFPQIIQANVNGPPLRYNAGDGFLPIVTNLDGAAARDFFIQTCSIIQYT